MNVRIWHNGLTYSADEITDIKIINEIDPMSATLITSVADITFKLSEERANFTDAPFTIRVDNTAPFEGKIEKVSRKDKDTWNVSLFNVIGYLDEFEFEGNVYKDKNAVELLNEILGTVGIQVHVTHESMASETVSGWIPICSCKEALSQVLFALGWTFHGTPNFTIFQFERLSEDIKIIDANRVLSGTVADEETQATDVEIMTHGFFNEDDVDDTFGEHTKYSPIVDQDAHFVFEPETPAFDFSYQKTGSSMVFFELVSESANRVVVNFNKKGPYLWKMKYKLYEHVTDIVKKRKEDAVGSVVYAIENKTLVTEANAQSVLDRCFEYYTKGKSAKAKIVEGKHVSEDGTITYDQKINVGDMVTFPTDWQGTYTGRVVKEQYNLNGNIIIKEITVK